MDPTERARRLRKSSTPPERVRWGELRGRRLGGLKFRRQHPVGPFVVDFFCESAMLAVEVDGAHHAKRRGADEDRDQYLRGLGLEVLRFSVSALMKNRDGVLLRIRDVATRRVGK